MTKNLKTSIEKELFQSGADFLVFQEASYEADSVEEANEGVTELNDSERSENITSDTSKISAYVGEEGKGTSTGLEIESASDIRSGIKSFKFLSMETKLKNPFQLQEKYHFQHKRVKLLQKHYFY